MVTAFRQWGLSPEKSAVSLNRPVVNCSASDNTRQMKSIIVTPLLGSINLLPVDIITRNVMPLERHPHEDILTKVHTDVKYIYILLHLMDVPVIVSNWFSKAINTS